MLESPRQRICFFITELLLFHHLPEVVYSAYHPGIVVQLRGADLQPLGIATPVGHYNPDWAIAFYEGTVKHIYFVAETKGSMSSMQLRLIEESKIHCAREHFKAISNGNVVYDVVDSYQSLLEKVMK